jgi:hypothetical protein
MTKDEALRLALEALEKLWNIIDDIDTYSDMVKADEKLYRSLVERRQRQRFEETGISTDGYDLHGGAITAIKAALEAKDEPTATKNNDGITLHLGWDDLPVGTKLYTTPPQRTWVGLTDEHKEGLICMTDPNPEPHHLRELIDVVEFQLKEKNT